MTPTEPYGETSFESLAPKVSATFFETDVCFVAPWLAISGQILSFKDVQVLKKRGITHIINCELKDDAPLIGDTFSYLHIPTLDNRKAKPPEWFCQALEFAAEARMHEEARILVHCTYGIARSPAIAYALLRHSGMPLGQATMAIFTRRPNVERYYWDDAEKALASADAQR